MLPTLDCVVMALLMAAAAVAAFLAGQHVLAASFAGCFCFAIVEYQRARAHNAMRADQHHYMSAQPDTDWDHFNESLLLHGRDRRGSAA